MPQRSRIEDTTPTSAAEEAGLGEVVVASEVLVAAVLVAAVPEEAGNCVSRNADALNTRVVSPR